MLGYALQLIHSYGYMALAGLLAVGILGLPVPDEWLLTFSGYLVCKGELSLLPTLVSAFFGSCSGITLSYVLGRTLGLYLLHRYGRFVHLTPVRLDRAHRWFQRWGKWGLFFGYFLPGIRHFTAYAAGAAELHPGAFAVFAYSGGLVWSATFVSLGLFLCQQWERTSSRVHELLTGGSAVVAVAVAIGWLVWALGKKLRRN